MTALGERLDLFVRWFFNSSPSTLIERRGGVADRDDAMRRAIALVAARRDSARSRDGRQ